MVILQTGLIFKLLNALHLFKTKVSINCWMFSPENQGTYLVLQNKCESLNFGTRFCKSWSSYFNLDKVLPTVVFATCCFGFFFFPNPSGQQ